MPSTIHEADAASGSTLPLRIGCAGWSSPRATWPEFPAEDSHLERYAARFNAVEINSSFYRPHRRETYARWAESTPAGFCFSVKVPKTITHELKLIGAMRAFDAFRLGIAGLGDKLGCLLVQLPPSTSFDAHVAEQFFNAMRQRHDGAVALEPRHATWFTTEADAVLDRFRVGRVLADPVLYPAGTAPGGWPGLVYLRLHGSPRRYWSAYADATLAQLAHRLEQARLTGAECWCVFDNTAGGEAVGNALTLAAATKSPLR